MRKQNLLLLLLLTAISFGRIEAAPVSQATAANIAANFFKVTVPGTAGFTLTPTLAYTKMDANGSDVDFYAFNMTPIQGFVIVSGCDATTPVLAYSTESNFTSVIPARAAINDWIKSAGGRVHYAIANNMVANPVVQNLWSSYAAGLNPNVSRTGTTVGPLMTTTYDQSPYYNALCPPAALASTNANKSVTGCVATAMAQVMKYWNWPPQGTGGTYSYTDNQPNYSSNYGTLSTNLNRPLIWSAMGNSSTSNTSAIDSLMYECGVSVDMDYAPSGSGAFVLQSDVGPGYPCAQYSYTNYFYYNSSSVQGIYLSNYSDAAWITAMEGEINAGRVVQYEGDDATQGGHTWIMDGYQTGSGTGGAMLHMNWGWGGYDDGYFDVTNLTTTGGFNPVQDDAAMIGILPDVSASVSTTPVCAGTSAQLSVSTGYPTGVTYQWSPTTGLGCATCATTSVTATANTTYTVTVSIAGYGTIGTASVAVNVSPLPAAPTSVTLPTAPCTGATATYSVPAVSGATSYTWSVSGTGWSGTSTTRTITLTAGTGSATVSVTANNSCGSSTAYVFTAPHGSGPSAPTSVTLPSAPCPNTTATYTVPTVSGATSYTWSVSGSGWSGSSTTNSATLTAGSVTGSVSVTANNSCGSSTPYVFSAPVGALPAAPSSVTLPTAPCTGATATYSVPAVSGATSYTWTVSGTGWSGTSTTRTITLTAGSVAGSITVKANNACGASAPYTFTAPHASGPTAPTSVTLPATPCQGSTATYTVPTVSGATSYTWTVSGTGWSGTSTTNSATLTAGSVSGSVSVTANNSCGSSTPYVFTAPTSPRPSAPTSVTLPAAPCTGATATYTVPTVSGATSYTWSVSGTGWSGSSTTNTITLTAGTGTASVSVTANNSCGSSTAYVFTAAHASGPTAPTSVTLPATPCQGATAVYTVPAVSGATSYTWSVSGSGWSGTSTTNSITLTAGSVTGSVSVTANNACGSSAPYIFSPASTPLPDAATTITAPSPICSGQSVTFTTPAISGATGYVWGVNGTGWSGSSTTNSITMNAGTGLLNLTVNGTNTCGSGQSYSLANVAVTETPVASYSLSSHTTGTGNNVTVTFNGTAPAGTTYAWDFDGGNANTGAGAGPQTVNWTTTGTKVITLTLDNGGCTSSVYSDTVLVTKSTTGIANINNGISFSVYPNPANTSVTVELQNTIDNATISMRDMIGQTLISRELTASSLTLDLTPYASGVYFIEIAQGSKTAVRKLIINK